MSCHTRVFQLAGEAQELFSVRHGPVRAARILPAPYISEYLHILATSPRAPLMFAPTPWIEPSTRRPQNVLKSGLFMGEDGAFQRVLTKSLILSLLLEVLFGLSPGRFTQSCSSAAFSGENRPRSVLRPCSGLLAYFSNVQWRHLKLTGSG